MKLPFLFSALIALSACGSTAIEQGAGFSTPSSSSQENRQTTQRTYTYGTEYARQGATNVPAPGLYKTSAGMPWMVVSSASARKGKAPLQGALARNYAESYASSKWRSPHAKRVNTADGSAMMRIVTVDGISFAVMRKVKAKAWLAAMASNDPYYKVMEQGIAQSGCKKTGETMIKMGQYGPHSIAAPVNCAA